MMGWLRRTFGWLERRWIRDPGERDRSTRRVRSRLGLGLDDEREVPAGSEERAAAGTDPIAGRWRAAS